MSVGRPRSSAIAAAYGRHRFAWLFATLLLTLGAGPTLDRLAPRYNILQLLLALNLLAAIASAARQGEMRLPLFLGIGFVAARVLQAALGSPALLPVSTGFWLVAVVLTLVTTVRHALGPGSVDTERIFAALDAYLLAGFLFAVAYWTLDQTWPQSFAGAPGGLDPAQALYFSFVTIATLGYGDVVPVSEPARGLTLVEAVSGQMYLTVLVARLVSLYAQQRRD